MDADVAVVGGGISGLAAAHFLTARGLRVVVLERDPRAGGAIGTIRRNGFLAERGPNSVLDTSAALRRLIDEVGLRDAVVYPGETAAKNRYIVHAGTLRALPTGPLSFVTTRLFSAKAKIRLLAEPFIRPAPAERDESLAEFTQRRLGREFLDYAIDPFVAGVFAGRADAISVKSAFPKLHALEQEHGSLLKGAIRKRRAAKAADETPSPGVQTGPKGRLFSFTDGMQMLVDALAQELGEGLLLGRKVLEVGRLDGGGYELTSGGAHGTEQHRAEHLLLTIPAHTLNEVEFGFEWTVADCLSRIEYPPVTSVFFGYRDDQAGRPLDGFGMLTPSKEGRRILGTIWNSSLFEGRTQQLEGMALTTFLGGSRQPELAHWSDDRLVEVVFQELRSLIGLKRFPDEVIVQRWPQAIPQYRLGHNALMAELDGFEERNPGLHIGGSFRKGISVANCVDEAEMLSARVAEQLAADGARRGRQTVKDSSGNGAG